MILSSINIALATAALSVHLTSASPCVPLPPKPVCKELMLPVKAAANNTLLPAYPNSTEPGVVYKYLTTFNATALPKVLISGSYNISAIYCEPSVKVQGREGTIQLLLHGLTGTKEYWHGHGFAHLNFEGQYSWMYHAASQGYASLAIDNLGNGHSSRPDPIQVVQTPMQLSVIFGIINGLRGGSFSDIANKYPKVIMAGHSYGSVLSRLMSQIFLKAGADAYILTATAKDITGLRSFLGNVKAQAASAVDPRFPNLPPGYLSVTTSIRESTYSLDGSFDPKLVEWDAKWPHVFTAGEVALSAPAAVSGFAGPVMVLTGRQDQIACGNGTIVGPVPECGIGPGGHVEQTRTLFPNASDFTAYVVDNTGHNPNSHYSAGESFGAAHAWLQKVGF